MVMIKKTGSLQLGKRLNDSIIPIIPVDDCKFTSLAIQVVSVYVRLRVCDTYSHY